MKKFYLLFILCFAYMLCINQRIAAAPFTSGNIVIYRVGDGTTALNINGSPVFLDEYTTSGTLVQSIALPTTASGGNNQLVAAGNTGTEGMLTRSTDGHFLVLAGYATNIPYASALSSTTVAAVNRVIGVIDGLGNINTTTKLTDAGNAGNPRSVVSTNGTDLWLASSTDGVRYTTLGSTTSTQVSSTITNIRTINIFNNQLYNSDASGAVRIGTVGTGTPQTSGNTITNLTGMPTSGGSPYNFFFADLDPNTPGVDVVYVADDAGTIIKYSLVGSTWTLNNTIAATAVRGLTGIVNGTSVTLFATTGGTSSTSPVGGGTIYSFTDNNGYNTNMTGSVTSIVTIPGGATAVAFRGVALVPIILPIVTAATQAATNIAAQTITAQSNTASGKIYIILNGVTQVTAADLDAAVAANRGASAAVATANTDVTISTTGLVGGTYYAYAVDGSGTVSPKGSNAITITDATIPVVTAAVQSTTNAPGQIVNVQSSEADGQVYIIRSDVTPQAAVADFTTAINASKGAVVSITLANTNVSVSTNGLLPGTYYAYAVDGAGNISPKGANAITITAPAVIVTAAAQSVTNLAGQTASVQSSQAGTVYIIRQEVAQITVADLNAASAATALDGAKVTTAGNVLESVSTAGLRGGTYYAYAVDAFGNISAKSVNAITIKTVVTAAAQTASNLSGQSVTVQSSVASGKVYIVLSSVAHATQANLDAAVAALTGASATVSSANSNVSISTTGLAAGTYYAYAADGGTTISDAGANAITIKDATPPVVSAGVQAITNLGQVARVQSSKASGFVYIIIDGTAKDTASFTAAIAAMKGAKAAVSAANTDIIVSGKGLLIGTYYAYAVDASGNVSAKSTNAITISGTTGTANIEQGLTAAYVSNHNLVINLTVRLSDKATAELFDMYGRKLAVYTLNEGSNVFSPALKGMFIVRIYNGSEIITRKLYLF